jgi:hypothetical protein
MSSALTFVPSLLLERGGKVTGSDNCLILSDPVTSLFAVSEHNKHTKYATTARQVKEAIK